MIITINSVLPDDKGNQYKVIKNIRPGGFGQVFLCERIQDKKVFALKTMLNVFPSQDEYNAFQNEINTARTIHNENVIEYEYMHDGNTFSEYPPYIIMEYASQGTLQNILEQRRDKKEFFSNDELTQMFLQLSKGMECINSVLVHRDIKPDNILINNDVLKISDFGLAKYVEATTRNVTFKGFGTRQYCAPEVWKNEKNTLQMDIYSMGIVFYELATLQYPYIIQTGDYMDAHLYGAVENPLKYNPQISVSIVSLLNKMLQKPRSKRFSSWKEIIELLEAGDNRGKQNDEIAKLVQIAIQKQNESDMAFQNKEAEEEKKKKEREDHVKKIMSYFDREIISGLKEFADVYNAQYASGKMEINTKDFKLTWEENTISIKMPKFQTFKATIEVLDPEKFEIMIGYEQYGQLRIPISKKSTYPTCRGRKVLAWGKIEDNSNYGYNILLLENKDDEYGDWFILYNVNSALNKNPRREPFAFSTTELPREIKLIDTTHIYSSVLEEYNLERFQKLIVTLKPL